MRKGLTVISAALLVTGLAACNRGSGNGSDDDRLNKSASMLDPDNGVVDTSADDAALNQAELPGEEGNASAPANATATNAVAPGNAQ